ncbi:MAG: CocE/NonD family hydrolase [Actinomycetota bacterium]
MRNRLFVVSALLTVSLLVPSAAIGAATNGQREPLLAICAGAEAQGPAWASKLPQPVETTVTKHDVQIESSDGTLIAARVYLPDAFAGSKPTLLVTSPYHSALGLYGRDLEDLSVLDYADCITPFFLTRGYAVVLSDMRGTNNSDGCFDYAGPRDQLDGYATVEWIADQPWSDGTVGMYGASHVGTSQYAAAVTAPPALKAIIPIAPMTSYYRYLHNGGVHYETNMATPPAYEFGVAIPPPTNVEDPNYVENAASSACSTHLLFRGMSLDGDFTNFFRVRDYSLMAKRITAAVFHTTGTLDQNVKMDHFTSMWRRLERENVPRKALIGPWGHSEPNVAYWRLTALRWYEHWLRGNDTGIMDEPTITTIDQMNTIRTSETLLPRGTKDEVLFASGGTLPGSPTEGSVSYTDIPGLPRQLLMEAEGARLLYDSEPFESPTRLVGAPTVDLVASIDTTDTNFVAHLYDLAPNGTASYISRGYLDARHREGLRDGVDVEPGVPLHYRIELLAHDYILDEGHRLRLLIASSDSCQWQVEFNNSASCRSSGVVSDTTAATVTALEGPEGTSLRLHIAPLSRKG